MERGGDGNPAASGPLTAEAMARAFLRARADRVGDLLATLGQAREVEPGSYTC